ncbi:hypothetical protein Poly59_29260 [Rubripirellula reticaptiva]|uniref:DUF58 domain-containing protein n=2 Tax=Rubripirellula reticaptiva TaxID=2528013 RepID=A0A5C6ESJ8_9BACT|nr:hypothetical protein Poly59_29260 [Rubripirellula reticaptiva]
MLGGALRGFNLLLVLAGLIVGTLIMQWRWSKRSVEAISVQRRLPTEAFAGKPFRIRYMLHNHSRLMPAWMMRVEDRIESSDRSDAATAICAAGVISAGQTVGPHCDCTVTRRGRYRLGPISLMTTFPFSLFSSRQISDDIDEFHVFPALLSLSSDYQRRLTTRPGGMSTTGRKSGPSEGDFFGLREWKTGDSPKWIHWRTTARMNEPAVRQFEQQRRFDTTVLVDGFNHSRNSLRSTPDDELATYHLERAISLAATLVIRLISSPSNRIVLAVAAQKCEAIIGTGSVAGKQRMLEILADVEPTDQPDIYEAAQQTLRLVGNTQNLIVISPRTLAFAKLADPKLIQALAPWTYRTDFRWICTSDRDLDRWVVREETEVKNQPVPKPLFGAV